jgi:hypothetical protein
MPVSIYLIYSAHFEEYVNFFLLFIFEAIYFICYSILFFLCYLQSRVSHFSEHLLNKNGNGFWGARCAGGLCGGCNGGAILQVCWRLRHSRINVFKYFSLSNFACVFTVDLVICKEKMRVISLFWHLNAVLWIWIQIRVRISVISWIRIRIKGISRIRIRIR